MPKRHLEANSKEERIKIRKQMGSLHSLTVQPATRARYDKALAGFFAYLRSVGQELPREKRLMDGFACDYLEHLWSNGEGRAKAADTLAGLQDTQPQLKGSLPGAWRLLRTWNSNEIPSRAPPLPVEILEAMIGYSLFKGEPLFALSLLLGFYGLLRTGEILALTRKQVTVSREGETAILSLGLTKSGKRQGAAESVTLHLFDAIRRLAVWVQDSQGPLLLCTSAAHWRTQFSRTIEALGFSHLEFRPYSLRRGGATFYFRQHGSFDKLLLHGRWQSTKTARIYVNEGLAILAELSPSWTAFARNLRSQYLNSLTKPLPQLEPMPKGRAGGFGKKLKSKKKRAEKVVFITALIKDVTGLFSRVWPSAWHTVALWLAPTWVWPGGS